MAGWRGTSLSDRLKQSPPVLVEVGGDGSKLKREDQADALDERSGWAAGALVGRMELKRETQAVA